MKVGEVTGPERGDARGDGPAVQRAQAGQQLVDLERLGQVVVGTDVEALHAVGQRVAGGEHQHGGPVALAAQPGDHLGTLHARQHPVHHDHVMATGTSSRERR